MARQTLAELMRRTFLTCALLSSANQLTCSDATFVYKTLKKSTSSALGTGRLSRPWSSLSLAGCVTRCITAYPTSCKRVIYHADLQLCTPGSAASSNLPVPVPTTEGDLYSGEQACGLNNAFTLLSGHGIQACVKLLDSKAFHEHQAECTSLGGFMASARTTDKLSLLQDFADSGAFIGLDDLVTEGTFVWHDTGLSLTASEESELFNDGEPNDSGGEDCVVHSFGTVTKMNDVPCDNDYPAICEFSLA